MNTARPAPETEPPGGPHLAWLIWAEAVLVVWGGLHWPPLTADAVWAPGTVAALRAGAGSAVTPLVLLPLVALAFLAVARAGGRLLVNRLAREEAERAGIEWTFSAPLARFLAGGRAEALPGVGPADRAAVEVWQLQEPNRAPSRWPGAPPVCPGSASIASVRLPMSFPDP